MSHGSSNIVTLATGNAKPKRSSTLHLYFTNYLFPAISSPSIASTSSETLHRSYQKTHRLDSTQRCNESVIIGPHIFEILRLRLLQISFSPKQSIRALLLLARTCPHMIAGFPKLKFSPLSRDSATSSLLFCPSGRNAWSLDFSRSVRSSLHASTIRTFLRSCLYGQNVSEIL